MRQRNRLYTVNKFNKPAFTKEENLFFPGGAIDWGSAVEDYANSKNAFGITKKDNPFSKMNLKNTFSAQNIGNMVESGLGAVSGTVSNLLSGGHSSGAGTALRTVGGIVKNIPVVGKFGAAAEILGGAFDGLFGGPKVDEAKLKAANEGTAQLNNTKYTANTTDELAAQASARTAVANVEDAYTNSLFGGGASAKNAELKEARRNAVLFADRSLTNAADNITSNQINDALANYAAFGGSLDFGTGALGLMQQNRYFDTIDKRSEAIAGKGQTMQTGFTGGAKTFAGGGNLEAAFLDDFGKDPIGAAVRYNQGLEQLAAQREAAQVEAAREAEYADMQKRLLNLETENQGLQAMMAAMPTSNPLPDTPTSSPATSEAAPDRSTWGYIEDQLRRSGKFNDVQIKGIKYNLQRESSINPDVVGDGGAAFGLGQWHGSRKPKDMSLEGQTRHLIDTISSFDGKEHWISKKDYEGFLNARTPEEAHYYLAKGYERPRADIVAKVKRDSDMSLKKLNAFGGELGTNGTDFTNGLLYIDEGGSHESNPLDGVPMGLDPEGIPNLVEEGETVYNDYVFSDRMNVPNFMLKDLGLPKSKKGISFADASKKLAQESEKRPNDPISKDGLQASLSRLAEIQETERMKQQAEEYMGLEGYACGGKLGHKYKLGSGLFGNGFNLDYSKYLEPAQAPLMYDFDTMMKIASIPQNGTKQGTNNQNTSRKVINNSSDMNYDGVHADKITWNFDPHEDEVREQMGFGNTPPVTEATRQAIAMEGYIPEYNDESAGAVDFLTNGIDSRLARESSPKTYDTWMRYAPAVGAGVMTLTDALGLTNKPDYTYAAGIEAAARAAGYAPDISYKPIGDYMRYTPLDRQYYLNQLMANSRATDRALSNSSSPSRAAGLLANGYNTTLSLGNLARQAEEYNRAQYERTKEFNRKTNMFNSQMDLEAAMANARYQQAAKQMGLSGLAQAAALRDSIDARIGASRSANLSNFLTSLGNIGRENFAMNQLNWDRSRNYYTDASGRSSYKKKKSSK